MTGTHRRLPAFWPFAPYNLARFWLGVKTGAAWLTYPEGLSLRERALQVLTHPHVFIRHSHQQACAVPSVERLPILLRESQCCSKLAAGCLMSWDRGGGFYYALLQWTSMMQNTLAGSVFNSHLSFSGCAAFGFDSSQVMHHE